MVFSKLKQARLVVGMKQEVAAKAVGITRSYLSQMENKAVPVSIEMLVKLARVYGVHSAELV